MQHEVVRERISLSDAIARIADRLRGEGAGHLLPAVRGPARTRQQVIITFLALLEMCKLKLIRVYQDGGQERHLDRRAKGDALAELAPTEVDET